MNKELVLHIGVHRTGTTSIQRALAEQREDLLEQGIRYAFDTTNHTHIAGEILAGHTSARAFIARLVKDAEQSSCRTVIVSGEDFCRLKKVRDLKPLCRHFDVRIVCYLRRQDTWLESWYNQHVRWPWKSGFSNFTPEEFYAHRQTFDWIDYACMLERWSEVFGSENLAVRVFEKDQLSDPLTRDYCEQFGIDYARLKFRARPVNTSLAPQAVEFLRHLDLLDKPVHIRQVFVAAVRGAYKRAGLNTVKHVYSGHRRRELLADFEDSNQVVARNYLGREDGILFREPWPEDDPEVPDISLPDTDELCRTIVRQMIHRQLEKIASSSRQAHSDIQLPDWMDAHHVFPADANPEVFVANEVEPLLEVLAEHLVVGLKDGPDAAGGQSQTGAGGPPGKHFAHRLLAPLRQGYLRLRGLLNGRH